MYWDNRLYDSGREATVRERHRFSFSLKPILRSSDLDAPNHPHLFQKKIILIRLRLKLRPEQRDCTRQALSTVLLVYTGKQLPALSKR